MKRRKITKIVKDEVTNALLINPDITANALKKAVEKALKLKGVNYQYTERTYLNLRNELLPKAGPRDLDKRWAIGACLKYNISLSLGLIDMYQILEDGISGPSIRQVRWFSLLLPILESRIEEEWSESDQLTPIGRVVLIANQYARLEQIAEVNEDMPDTSWLDHKYFIEEDFSEEAISEGLLRSYWPPEDIEALKEKYGLNKNSGAVK